MTTSPEHPWIPVMRRKLRERGFEGDRLDAEVNRLMNRFPFLRGKAAGVVDPKTEALHRAIRVKK